MNDAYDDSAGGAVEIDVNVIPVPVVQSRIVWHYTDAAGLLGILDSRALWASSASAVNDTSELRLGPQVLEQAWQSLAPRLAEQTRSELEPLVVGALTSSVADRAFVLSASLERDNLNLWQHYASAGGGFAVGIWTEQQLEEPIVGTSSSVLPYWWQRVIYDPRQARAEVLEVLRWLAAVAESDEARHKLPHCQFVIETLLCSIKHRGFHAEREARRIMVPDPSVIKYRAGAHGIVPYVELVTGRPAEFNDDGTKRQIAPGERQPLPIAEVVCGPSHDPESAQRLGHRIRTLLNSSGYEEARLLISNLPYRANR